MVVREWTIGLADNRIEVRMSRERATVKSFSVQLLASSPIAGIR